MEQLTDTDDVFGMATRTRRAQLGMTLDQLAKASGVSSGALSRIERGQFSPTLRNAVAIAQGLGCELNDLLQTPSTPITREGEHVLIVDEDTGISRQTLARPTIDVELLLYRVPALQRSKPFAAHAIGTREIFHILQGQLHIHTQHEHLVLNRGDTATLLVDSEHWFANSGSEETLFSLLIVNKN